MQPIQTKTGRTSGQTRTRMTNYPYDQNDQLITKEQCKEMIDDAIRQHNRNASIISFCVGWVVLALFAEGLLRLIGVIDPVFPWLDVHTLL